MHLLFIHSLGLGIAALALPETATVKAACSFVVQSNVKIVFSHVDWCVAISVSVSNRLEWLRMFCILSKISVWIFLRAFSR